MRFRSRQSSHLDDSGIPTIDLIPMLTVMMGVLAFFVVISVSFGSEQLIQVDLPAEQTDEPVTETDSTADPFIVEMDETGQQFLNNTPVAAEQLAAEVQAYLARNPDKIVYLLPSRELPYEQVMQFLGNMRAVGGDRVSLALEEQTDQNAEASAELK